MEVAAETRPQETSPGDHFGKSFAFPFLSAASQGALARLLKAGMKPAAAMMASASDKK